MTYLDLIEEMETLGFPCTYGSYKSAPKLPYTVIQFYNDDDFKADNHNYLDIGDYQLEYYNSKKYPPDEKKIEDRLKELRLPYSKTEAFLDSEDLYQIVYEIQLIGG